MSAVSFYVWATVATVVLPFVLCLLLRPIERAFPRRLDPSPLRSRWRVNFSLGIAATALALLASVVLTERIGSFGADYSPFSLAAFDVHWLLKVVIAFLLIDFLAYVIHWLSHKIELLWQLHQVHHSDDAFDASTGLRHQPLEGLIGFFVLTFISGLVGIPFVVIAIYGLVSAAHSILQHANVALPPAVDRILRLVVVTPDMHRLHHSASAHEYNSNYGQVLSLWDAAFGTSRFLPSDQQARMALGLGQSMATASALKLTLIPFQSVSKPQNSMPKHVRRDTPKPAAKDNRKKRPR